MTGVAVGGAVAAASARAAAPIRGSEAEDGDFLVMLGVNRGPIMGRSHLEPATALVVDGGTYLIDCGSDTAHQMMMSGLGISRLKHVFVTHRHLDHIGGIPMLSPMGWAFAPAPLVGQVGFWGPPRLAEIVEASHAALGYSIDLFGSGHGSPTLSSSAAP